MKIAISGAGVAGPALAYWLLKGGHTPTLIEAAPRFRDAGYMIDFWGVGYTVAERMGLLPAIRDAGYFVKEVRFVDARGAKTGGFHMDVLGKALVERFVSLPRGNLAKVIYRAIEDRVETLFGASIAAMEDRGTHVSTRIGGRQQDFDLVIGADGLHSQVRALAVGPQAAFERRLGYSVAAFEVAGYRPRDELAYVSYGMPGRQLSRFALRGDRTMILFVFATDHYDGPEPHDLESRKNVIRRVFGGAQWEWPAIRDALDAAEEVYFDSVSQIVMPSWSKGRVCLIGDAAGCVSLLAGEGTGLAMTEAYVLAGELAVAGDDHRAAFAEYERRLRPLIARKQKAARNFAGSFAPRTRLGLWFRDQMTRLMAIPTVAEAIIGADIRDNFDLPDYGAH
jgi:2-polyprenyl-6-methoxyphenol hydroxylase-like FAD-dependent oxidoreductase